MRRSAAPNEQAADARAFNAPPEIVAELDESAAGDVPYVVLREAQPILQAFLDLDTQWRLGPMGGVMGLDYAGMAAMFAMTAPADPRALFKHLRAMEAAALCVLNEGADG
jgi:hypothetical protein